MKSLLWMVPGLLWVMTGIQAQTVDTSGPDTDSQPGVVTYSAEFLHRYQPNTALDMVNRIPGFILDNGGDQRGFGGSPGNVLINDRRPSAKKDQPSAILNRIPADVVEKIELIRVKVRDIDLLGQPVVVNVILKEESAATIRWDANIRFNLDYGTTPHGAVSLAHHWGGVEYNVGVDYRNTEYGDPGVIKRYDPNGMLIQIRDDADTAWGYDIGAYGNASAWVGENLIQVNAKFQNMPRTLVTASTQTPQNPTGPSRKIVFETIRDIRVYELGLDAERTLGNGLIGKGILLMSRREEDPSSSQQDFDTNGFQTRFQDEDEFNVQDEIISRLEFNWAAVSDHVLQANAEYALNTLDNELVFTDDTGAGPVVVDVAGGNTRVEEDRWNLLLQDTWSLGKFDWEYGVGYERSTISQSGDATKERTFNYIKPRTMLTWSQDEHNQSRLRIEREVSQLDFIDFVTATVFEDNNVSLGNPDLRPDRTWIFELSHERRFGSIGVIKLTGFYHRITDVLDQLPLSATFETTGNIGDGRKIGVILASTLPLDWTGLDGARLDFKVRFQDTEVTDPVTGEKRTVSIGGGFRNDVLFDDDTDYAFTVNYRQDFEAAKVSWGWSLAERGERILFKADELDINNEKFEIRAFIETTRWFGIKLALEGMNLMDNPQSRDRTIYTGARGSSPVLLREFREGDNGRMIFIKASGSF